MQETKPSSLSVTLTIGISTLLSTLIISLISFLFSVDDSGLLIVITAMTASSISTATRQKLSQQDASNPQKGQ